MVQVSCICYWTSVQLCIRVSQLCGAAICCSHKPLVCKSNTRGTGPPLHSTCVPHISCHFTNILSDLRILSSTFRKFCHHFDVNILISFYFYDLKSIISFLIQTLMFSSILSTLITPEIPYVPVFQSTYEPLTRFHFV